MIDTAYIHIRAGNGGNGRVSFLRLKFMPKGGPDGGDGGDGGSIFFVGDKDMNTLQTFAGRQKYEAVHGGGGGKWKKTGANGSDLEIKVPVGTVIWEAPEEAVEMKLLARERPEVFKKIGEITKHGQRMLIAQGGKGGRGNDRFKSSENTTPRFAEDGTKGEQGWLFLELKLLADVGLIGFPNAGKSTLLSVLTRANPEIGAYPFTTLTPNLGVMEYQGETRVLADIPGLIEGASAGKGLGIEFLRHVERCQTLVFVLSLDESMLFDESLTDAKRLEVFIDQYKILDKEIRQYQVGLEAKPRIICVNKQDLYSGKLSALVKEKLGKKLGVEVFLCSAATHEGLEELTRRIFE